jgi:membrane associated rhomboid family serine protease
MVQRFNKDSLKPLFYPALLSALMILFFILVRINVLSDISFVLFPRSPKYIYGIITSPFGHGDFMHLFGNLFAFLPLSYLLFYLYKKDAKLVFVSLWIVTGFLVWVFARPVFHIGASGVVYALQAFILCSGILKGRADMMAIAGLCIILFGTGFYFGMLPVQEGISWESHLLGFLAGIGLSFVFLNKGPKNKRKSKRAEHHDLYHQFDHRHKEQLD